MWATVQVDEKPRGNMAAAYRQGPSRLRTGFAWSGLAFDEGTAALSGVIQSTKILMLLPAAESARSHGHGAIADWSISLPGSVTVAQEILVLFVQVRILTG